MKKMFIPTGLMICAGALSFSAQSAMITYDTWMPNDGSTGNYIFTVDDDTAGKFNYNLTVNPWNAEALGLFIDLGVVNIGSVGLTNTNPVGQVSVFATDTTSNSCGSGCNLNGLSLTNEWELVFRLGNAGFDSIQTFSWTTLNFGLTLSDFGQVAARAQQLCSGTDTLDDGDSNCGDSDKSYSASPTPPVTVPEPGTLALLGLGLAGLGISRRRAAK